MINTAEIGAKTNRETRYRRYSKVDLTRIKVSRASTAADLDIVGKLREAGFARIAAQDGRNISWVDEIDTVPGVFSLIGYDLHVQPIATMRVQDGRIAPLELRKFVPLDSLLQLADQPAAQFARLSVVKTPSVPYTHRSVLLIENGNGPGQKASRSWNAAPPRKFAKRSAW